MNQTVHGSRAGVSRGLPKLSNPECLPGKAGGQPWTLLIITEEVQKQRTATGGPVTARAKSIGSTMTTLHKAREQDIKNILAIPDNVDTIALIPLGYPEGSWARPKRKPQREVTFWNSWGDGKD